jgi:hypothetical protein
VVHDPLVPLRRFCFQPEKYIKLGKKTHRRTYGGKVIKKPTFEIFLPVKGQQLVTPVNSSHAFVVGGDEGWPGDTDVCLFFLVPAPNLNI